MELKTRRSAMFYFSFLIMVVLCGGLGTLLLWVGTSYDPIDYGMLTFTAVFYLLGIYFIIKCFKNTPIVRMSDEGIRYRGRWYSWSQITYANFKTKRNFPGLGRTPMDVVTLSFSDKQELYLFDQMYSNADEIRTYLAARVKAELVIHDRPVVKAQVPRGQEADQRETTEQDATSKAQNWKRYLLAALFTLIFLAQTILIVWFGLPDWVSLICGIPLFILYRFAYIRAFGGKR